MIERKMFFADMASLRAATDLAYDGALGIGFLILALLLWRQRPIGALDLPALLIRRELVCLLTMMALARVAEIAARISVWFEVPAAGLRISLIGVTFLMVWHAWKRSGWLKGE